MLRSFDAATELGAYWAAKEAAFKAAVKFSPGIFFSPGAFEVTRGNGVEGCVQFDGLTIQVCWQQTRDWVHCLALAGEPRSMPSWNNVRRRVCRLAPAATGAPNDPDDQSAQVRALAASLLREAGLEDAKIIRDSLENGLLGPPYALHETAGRVDLSLSHDGDWIAAAVLHG